MKNTPESVPNIIEAEHVSYDYELEDGAKAHALKDVSLRVPRGQFLAVLGHNGSGKSTFAKLLNAIYTPLEGTVRVVGIDTRDEDRVYDIRRQVGMVFQNPDNQLVATVVEEDVAFALENIGTPQKELRARVDEALKAVGMYDHRLEAPHHLSGGQKQRVAIAGVLALRPACIVLDEPTAMLDPRGRKEVMRTLHRLHAGGVTVVLITHFMDEAAQAGRVCVMDNGELLLDGTPADVFADAATLRNVGLDVPQVTQMADALGRAGITLPHGLLTAGQLADAVARLLEVR